jgi:hypothetical protein
MAKTKPKKILTASLPRQNGLKPRPTNLNPASSVPANPSAASTHQQFGRQQRQQTVNGGNSSDGGNSSSSGMTFKIDRHQQTP